MKEELFNYTVKKYQVSEFLDTNPIRPLKKEVEDDFDWGVIETSLSSKRHTSYTPWGDYTFKADYDTEEKFVEHYGNPFAQLYLNRAIVSVTKENDKVSFKVFNYYKSRRVAGKWFKLRTNCKFITFNYKTNALYVGSLDNYHLKRKCRKRVSRVLFNNDPINQMRQHLRDSFNIIVDKDKVDIPTIVNQVISTFVNAIPGTEKYPELLSEQKIYRRYLDAQGIKYPNNWFELVEAYPQPKKKDLVKCDYKYVDALMRVHNLKGDKIKKSLHNVSKFVDAKHLNNACEFFGEKFILNQSDEVINLLLSAWDVSFLSQNFFNNYSLSKSEKLNFFEIYKLYYKKLIDYYTVNDHIRFYNFLQNVEPVKWKSKTHDEFSQEHYDWSEKYNHYTNGDFNRIYNPTFVDKVNEVILTKDGPYFPEVLITSKRYNNESFFQNNCVKTYIKRVGSVLISLRRGEGETEERASIEIEVTPLVWPDEMYFNLRRVQTLGKRNNRLDNSWDDVLSKLDERIEYIVRERLFDTLQIGGEFGGRKVFSDYVIKDYSRDGYEKNVTSISKGVYLAWENDSIMKLNSYNLNTVTIYNDPDALDF
jgi:hypothetical protein